MYLCPPTNTPEVIRAIGNSEKLIHVFVAAAVIIAVVALVAALKNTNPDHNTRKELTHKTDSSSNHPYPTQP